MRGEVWVRTIVLAGLVRALTCGYARGGGMQSLWKPTPSRLTDNSGVTRRLGPTETDGPFRSSTLACGLAVGRWAGISTARVMRTFMHRHCCGLRCRRSAFPI